MYSAENARIQLISNKICQFVMRIFYILPCDGDTSKQQKLSLEITDPLSTTIWIDLAYLGCQSYANQLTNAIMELNIDYVWEYY